MANTETAAQPIDLDKRRCNCGKTVDVCVVTPCHNFHDTGIDTELENYAALARQQHEPSGNAGEVAASDDVEMRLRAQAAIPFGPEGFDLIAEAAQHIAYLRAQLARQATPQTTIKCSGCEGKPSIENSPCAVCGQMAAPHAQAEPVAWLRFWAAQYSMGEGNIGVDEGLEVCEPHDIGMDGRPAFPVYAEYVPVPQEAEQRPSDDELWDATLRDRDAYHDWADKLADAIATHFGVDIGEHSNQNLPWAEALEAIESAGLPQEAEQAAPAAVSAIVETKHGAAPFSYPEQEIRTLKSKPAAPVVTDAARDVLADAKGGA